MSEEIGRILAQKGAVLNGHFRLSSGRHSDVFVQKFRLFEDPSTTLRCAEKLAMKFDSNFDAVASPAVGALVFGFATAVAAGCKSIFAERVHDRMAFRRGFELAPGEPVLVVEDVVTTGASAREILALVAACGARPVGLGALVDRSDPAAPRWPVPFESLVTMESRSWTPDECPLCAKEMPLDDPGSRRLPI